ncbi:glucans biosynthesis glucosyltransferase MdoH [Stieleria sp. TO1_6]|uniref:glucans biosynthesis glucosyltransferase MdoH n=1 Tax=Stieleria tagensis TaxID=2956795 RepID=UPI00209AD0DF|nr:glucans biosynthesis glucosyltransferase MdoH [Stieleria tagensis]MCO8123847.1 glucans biosynthesis glucosyltransferase MdoH [Stieleria tagensis]
MRTERAFVAAFTLLLTFSALLLYHCVMQADGEITVMEWIAASFYAVLAAWLSFSLSLATLGFAVLLRDRIARWRTKRLVNSRPLDASKRTAVLIPIYNESPTNVFAGAEAMYRSLAATGQASLFDFFVLSDTTDVPTWLAEEAFWERLANQISDEFPDSQCRVHYRHRGKNVARKAGNIAEFCTKWGSHYDYMIILDADSLVEGDTMVEMVRRMDADDRLGIYQVPPVPIGRQSLFARIQQFSSDVYGPIFNAGFSRFAGSDANYFGHNAILRVEPFIRHCDLPHLGGAAPLGGEILSHDFVEAALMLRAGYKVEIADHLGGSYEECPTTIADFAKRDQRWCQGNLQHARLIASEGFHPFSRLHFLTGVLSYCSSPLWMLFLAGTLLTAIGAETNVKDWPAYGLILFAATMFALLLPKIMAVIISMMGPQRAKRRGGVVFTLLSAIVETVASVLISPVMALHHTRFVLSNLAGFNVRWTAQQRDDCGVSWRQAAADNWPATRLALFVTLALYAVAPQLLIWFSPILLGLWLAIPVAVLMGSSRVGLALARWNLLSTQFETQPPAIKRLCDEVLDTIQQDRELANQLSPSFETALRDPQWIERHARLLFETETSVPADEKAKRAAQAIKVFGSIDDIPPSVQFQMLADRDLVLSLQ